MKYFTFYTTLFLSSFFTQLKAQSEEYRKQSEETRKQVWAWDKPQFRVRAVPQQYANASKVFLAHHTELSADSKSKVKFYGLAFGVSKEQTLTEIVREMVKVNDKNAVTEYSELSFTQFEKTSGFYTSTKTTSYVGVRVIKPDGSIKEINADDIVLTKDESSQKKAKLAIPDLQPGDILDYFIATQQSMLNDFSSKPYRILLFDDAPVLSLSFHAQLGKKYAIEYRSYNGAPELAVSKNDDAEIIVNVEKTNVPPFETNLWVAPGMQLPFIRMNISLGYRGLGQNTIKAKKPGEVLKNGDPREFLRNRFSKLINAYENANLSKAYSKEYLEIINEAKSKAKHLNLSYNDLNNQDKAALLYYTLRYTKLLNFDISELSKKINIGDYRFENMDIPLLLTFKFAKLEPDVVIGNTRTGIRMDEIMDASDLTATAYLPEENVFFSIQSIYDIPFIVPSELEGLTNTKSMAVRHMKGDPGTGPNVPISNSDKNAHIENLKLSLAAGRNSLLVHRSTTLKGYYKNDAQRQLILYEDFYESERKSFNDKQTLMQDLEDGKKSKKYIDEVKSAFAEARLKQKDAFVKEAKDWFEQEVIDLKDYKTDTLGVRHTAPNFVYSSSFNLLGLLKKAGNNIIFEVGKIQGKPYVVRQDQRKRDIDIYMPYARSIEYNLELEIPAGYTVEGLAVLNKKVENATGYFITESSATDKLVSIKIKKHYLHNFEDVKNWDKLLVIMDAANDWTNTKLLLKKK